MRFTLTEASRDDRGVLTVRGTFPPEEFSVVQPLSTFKARVFGWRRRRFAVIAFDNLGQFQAVERDALKVMPGYFRGQQ